jgi:predicted nucleic acid-binding Zn ribbon protein
MDTKGPKSIGDILRAQHLPEQAKKKEDRAQKLKDGWKKTMGDACAEHTEDIRLEHGVLRVRMDSQLWQQELLMQDQGDIARRMAEATKLNVVDLKIRAGGGKLDGR